MQSIEFLQRDRATIEVRSYHPIPGEGVSKSKASLDVYTFIPISFGASPLSTSSQEIAKHYQSLYRINFPKVRLETLLDLSTEGSPLKQLNDYICALPGGLHEYAGADLSSLTRFCGAELVEAVFRDCQDIEDKFNHPTSLSKSQTELELLCKRIVKSTNLLKELERKSACFQYSLPTGFYDTLCVVGEYFSVTASEQLSALAQSESVNRLDPQAQETIRRVIGRTVEKIMRVYRLLPLEALETKDQEYLTYRTNRLKKEVQRTLYLEPESNERVELISNSAAMVAAGLAALWATTAQIPLLSGHFGETTSALFFAVAIGAYILKDRIKEIIRRQLSKRWSPWDRLYHFQLEHLSRFGVGAYRGRVEHTSKWTDESSIDSTIKKARSQQRSVGEVDDELEHIHHHHQNLSMNCDATRTSQEECGVQQVIRLSLDSLLPRLDEPLREIHAYNPETGNFTSASLPRVYHLNLVARLTSPCSKKPLVARCRAVVNSKRVIRLEYQRFESSTQSTESRRLSA